MPTSTFQVGASARDASESGTGVVTINGTYSHITGTSGWYGCSFTGVNIAPGDTVTSAILELYMVQVGDDFIHFDIYGEDADNSGIFTTGASDISGRTPTTATVAWNADSTGVGFQASPELITIIQEIVDRGGWASGNAITLLLDAITGIDARIRNWDGSASQAPKLTITWTTPSSGSGTVDLIHLGSPTAYDTIQEAIDAAVSGDTIEIGARVGGEEYYEALNLTSVTGVTIQPKAGEDVVISGVYEELYTSPETSWVLHETVSSTLDIYRTTISLNVNNNVQGFVRNLGEERRLFTYGSYDNMKTYYAEEGIFYGTDTVTATTGLFYIKSHFLGSEVSIPQMLISKRDYVLEFNNTDDIVIDGSPGSLIIEVGGESVIRMKNSDGNTIQNCTIRYGASGIWYKNDGDASSCNDNIIENVTLYDVRESHWTWEDIKLVNPRKMETFGFKQGTGGTGNIVRNNHIYGWFDAVSIGKVSANAVFLDGTLVHGNTIHDVPDDVFEIDYHSRNIEIFDNYVYDAYICLSNSPFPHGPMYFYRNRVICDKPGPSGSGPRLTKRSAGDACDEVFIYHNTMYSTKYGWQVNNGAPAMTNWKAYNNIIAISGDVTSAFALGTAIYTDTGNDFDGNCYYDVLGTNFNNDFQDFCADGLNFASLAAFLASATGIASGWEVNGMADDPDINLGVYPYSLEITNAASPVIDAGVTLPAWPDRTIYNGDLTIGASPFDGPAPPAGSRIVGLVRAAAITTTGNQTFRDPNLTDTPNACIILVSSATADGTLTADISASIGIAVSSTSRSVHSFFETDNVATTSVRRRTKDDKVVMIQNTLGNIVAEADFVQFEANVGSGAGLTINWTDAAAAAYLVTVIMFKATNAAVVEYTGTVTVDGTVVVSSMSFELDVGFWLSSGQGIPVNGSGRHSSWGVGLADLTQRCWAQGSGNGGANTAVRGQYSNNRVAAETNADGTFAWSHELTAVSATGFTITNRIGSSSTEDVAVLALEFADNAVFVGDFSAPTSTGVAAVTTGFVPQFGMLGFTNAEVVNTAYADNKAGVTGIGAFTEDNAYSMTWITDDGATPTYAKSLSDDVPYNKPEDTGTTLNLATFDSFNATDFSLNHTNVAANAKLGWAFALEAGAATATVPLFMFTYRKRRQ